MAAANNRENGAKMEIFRNEELGVKVETVNGGEPCRKIGTITNVGPSIKMETGEPGVKIETLKNGEFGVKIETVNNGVTGLKMETITDGGPLANVEPGTFRESGRKIETVTCEKSCLNMKAVTDRELCVNMELVTDNIEGEQYQCDVCAESFVFPAELKEHLRCHIEDHPYVINITPKEEPDDQSVPRDVMEVKTESGQCDEAIGTGKHGAILSVLRETTTSKAGNVKVKQTDANTSIIYRTQCTICGQKFCHVGHLNGHMKKYHGEKPYACAVCHDKFDTRRSREKHLLTSIDEQHVSFRKKEKPEKQWIPNIEKDKAEKPFSCYICSQMFSVKANLSKHMTIHTGPPPYPCVICNKSFDIRGSFFSHMRTHSAEKPYRCSVCGNMFNRKANFDEHEVMHVKEKLRRQAYKQSALVLRQILSKPPMTPPVTPSAITSSNSTQSAESGTQDLNLTDL